MLYQVAEEFQSCYSDFSREESRVSLTQVKIYPRGSDEAASCKQAVQHQQAGTGTPSCPATSMSGQSIARNTSRKGRTKGMQNWRQTRARKPKCKGRTFTAKFFWSALLEAWCLHQPGFSRMKIELMFIIRLIALLRLPPTPPTPQVVWFGTDKTKANATIAPTAC